MTVPQNRIELLAAINGDYAKLRRELDAVDAALVVEKTLEGHAKGTRMSVHDLVAYLVGWNRLLLKWLSRRARGEAVDFPETGFGWNELGRLAGKFYADREAVPYAALLEELARAKEEIVWFVEGSDDARLYGSAWYGKWTMGRMIQFNTSSPYANARGRLRRWRRERAGA